MYKTGKNLGGERERKRKREKETEENEERVLEKNCTKK